jgi:hypothetical protein
LIWKEAWITKPHQAPRVNVNIMTSNGNDHALLEVGEETGSLSEQGDTSNGEYKTTSAYKAQFLGATLTNMNKMVWKL